MVDLYDKTGREIMVNDVLKVFHFIGARRKRHYMYKQAVEVIYIGENRSPYLRISHLNGENEGYTQKINGCVMENTEIVQGFSEGVSYEDRPKELNKD